MSAAEQRLAVAYCHWEGSGPPVTHPSWPLISIVPYSTAQSCRDHPRPPPRRGRPRCDGAGRSGTRRERVVTGREGAAVAVFEWSTDTRRRRAAAFLIFFLIFLTRSPRCACGCGPASPIQRPARRMRWEAAPRPAASGRTPLDAARGRRSARVRAVGEGVRGSPHCQRGADGAAKSPLGRGERS